MQVALTVSPVNDAGGKIVGISTIARDITERQSFEAERSVLLDELSHRVKNALAIVLSIARQTLGDDAHVGFEPRLMALSHVFSTAPWVEPSNSPCVRTPSHPQPMSEG